MFFSPTTPLFETVWINTSPLAEKLTTEHTHQGTKGYYYLFYNTFLELLFLEDTARARANRENFGSDYWLRWGNEDNANPVAFGMRMSPWDTSGTHQNFHVYPSHDTADDAYYLMPRANQDGSQPLIYLSQPHRAYEHIESLEDVNQRPAEIQDDLRNYLTHPSGVQRLTHIIYACPVDSVIEGNMEILQENRVIEIEQSDTTSITLVFDDKPQRRKEFWVNDHVTLILEY